MFTETMEKESRKLKQLCAAEANRIKNNSCKNEKKKKNEGNVLTQTAKE